MAENILHAQPANALVAGRNLISLVELQSPFVAPATLVANFRWRSNDGGHIVNEMICLDI
jgi:hypothetical protein